MAGSACWKQPGNQNNNVVMLHICILTFILAESKALCTVNTCWGWHPATLESEGKWMTGVWAASKDNRVQWDWGCGCQFYNMIFRYQLLRAFTLNLIPTGDTAYMIHLTYAKRTFRQWGRWNAWGSKFREQWHTLGVPTVFKSRPSLVITNTGASIAGLFSPPQE